MAIIRCILIQVMDNDGPNNGGSRNFIQLSTLYKKQKL